MFTSQTTRGGAIGLLLMGFDDIHRQDIKAVMTAPQAYIDSLWEDDASNGYSRNTPATKALGLPAVWASVNLIAGHIAAMPLEVRRTTTEGSRLLEDHPGYRVLNHDCGTHQTPFVLKQTLMAHALLSGNGRAWIERDEFGRPVSLVILPPEATYTVMLDGVKYHSVYFDSNYIPVPIPFGAIDASQEMKGTGRSGLYTLHDDDVLHIPAFGWSGLIGYGVAWLARTVFETDRAGQDTASFVFKNRGMPSLLLEAPKGILPGYKEADEFLRWFKKGHQGVSNAAKIGLLRDGITANVLPLSAEDSQFLQSREFSRQEIALLLGTEYLLGEVSAVYKDLSERQSAYLTNTLAKWLKVWTDECERKLLSFQQFQRRQVFFKFDARQLLKGTPNSLADYTGKLRQQGAITGNEVREIHGFNTVAGEEMLDTFGNPNITTEATVEEEPADSAEDDTAEDPQARVNPIVYMFADLIRSERERVKAIAKNPATYHDKLSTYYGRYEKTLLKHCAALEIDAARASEHITESKRQLNDLFGTVPDANLSAAVGQLTATWDTRAEAFK
jgi:HK97 family phage portal protein